MPLDTSNYQQFGTSLCEETLLLIMIIVQVHVDVTASTRVILQGNIALPHYHGVDSETVAMSYQPKLLANIIPSSSQQPC